MFFEITLKFSNTADMANGHEATVLVQLTKGQEEEAAFEIAERALRAHHQVGDPCFASHSRKIQRYVGEENLKLRRPDFVDESGAKVWLR